MSESASQSQGDIAHLISLDPWLVPHQEKLRQRFSRYQAIRARIERDGGLLGPISQGHHRFGLNRGEQEGQPGVWYREWAPGAQSLALIGDFNGWDRQANPLTRDQWGVWSVFLSDALYGERLLHGSRVKVHVVAANGALDRIPAYARRVVQEPDNTFTAQYWQPPAPYTWQHPAPQRTGGLRIYEAHVGMAQEEGKVGTFDEFTRNVLPRIADLGYNAIQLMAIMQHPYYASFGYHVSSFYAVSSWFGDPEDLKRLVDTAHGMGLQVVIDLVHSHAVKNVREGLNRFDGTEYQYFHAGKRGEHAAWDSLCFDYARYEVQRFLLSNVRFWLEEYRFDGFRFDGVTSMLYLDHGLARTFTSYEDYFSANVDPDAISYLMLANDVMHAVNPDAISIAEDVSGMVGLARPTAEGGLGFDYRLAMGIPDYWIKLLKEQKDEEWDLAYLYHRLLDRRYGEKHIGYAESHDQALVGDQTIAFRLMGSEMYRSMSKFTPSVVVDRGVALHKMIRLITFSLGGEGYLNFMGNEFGHPEWIDFPRAGNHFSFQYARRQWSLADDTTLCYGGLRAFDKAMLRLDSDCHLLEDPFIERLAVHEDARLLVYRRGPLVFAFNFHPTESYSHLRIPVPDRADYRVLLNTDDREYDGKGLVTESMVYPWQDVPTEGRGQSLMLYLPARSAQVLGRL
ncbi:MAG TPA: alpha-amylase family glycosyl hydrolase [Chthonomonadaceae bacterium]|nr:alpha-amylase family glycosyl hydrolase [Chthonomonadaceae bacterium]